MEGSDDVDEDELALAMSTELSRPTHTLSDRRTRSFTSLGDAEANSLMLSVSFAGTCRPVLSPIPTDRS
jgi:hypothetical protein